MTTQPNAVIPVEEPKRKKRGGQPGNTNAIKHGFYSKNFSLAERRGLQVRISVVLGDEIALLRVLIRRFAEQIQASQDLSLTESAQHLAVISEAMLRLGNLLRTDHMLGGSQSDTLFKSLHVVLEELAEERALDEG
jgi:hypothetical protein